MNRSQAWALALLLAAGCGAGNTVTSSDSGLATLDFRQTVRKAKDQVFPAVVFIRCLTENRETGRKITEEVAGSGVIISAGGEVLTNWHVIDKATEIRCLLYDGRAMYASLVGADKDTDLALLQLHAGPVAATSTTAPASAPATTSSPAGVFSMAELGDSAALKEGDFVMAMGAPWGLSRSVSIGIISCTRRYLPDQSEYSLWLQTDASISPGNSGGPLVNTDGRVIGITTLGVSHGGDMGFAVPAETIRYILPQLRRHHGVNWSWTGLQLQPLRDFNRNIFFDETEGVIVAETDPESPARRAGLLPRDRIVRINGRPMLGVWEEDLPGARRELGLLEKHAPAKVELVRNGKLLSFDVTPREKGKVEGEELDCPRWDLTVKTINQFDNPDLFYYRKKGVFVYGVKYPGNAASRLEAKDIIVSIEGKEVTTLEEVKAIHKESLDNIATKNRLRFTVLRNGLMKQFVLDISRDYQKD